MKMSYSKLILVFGLISIWLSLTDAKPVKAKSSISKTRAAKTNFFEILGKREQNKCEEILGSEVDLKVFTDEVAYAYFNSGNVQALDELLKYLVEMECFTLDETVVFRNQLVTIYDLIHKHVVENKEQVIGKNNKRSSLTSFDYYNRINFLIDELDFAFRNGNEKSSELLKYMVEYILILEESNQLTPKQSNTLLEKIKDLVSLKEEALGQALFLDDEWKPKAERDSNKSKNKKDVTEKQNM